VIESPWTRERLDADLKTFRELAEKASRSIDDMQLSTHVYCIPSVVEGIVSDLRRSIDVLEKVAEKHGRAGWCDGGISALQKLERDIGIGIGVRVEGHAARARLADAAKEEVSR